MDPDLTRARRRSRRNAGPALIVAVGLHVAVFLAIGLITPRPAFVSPPDPVSMQVRLVRPPRLRVPERPPPPRSAAPSVVLPLPHVHQAPTPSSAVAASPVPAASSPSAVAIGTSVAPGPLPAEATPHGVNALLRGAIGCDNDATLHLTPEEKVACAQKFGRAGSVGVPYMGMSVQKQAAFGAQAAADERRRQIREGNMPALVVPCDGPGSNYGVGCLPPSAIVHTGSH